MKKRVQGEALRIEDCPEGGQHVLMRPVQKYCDRCRPKQRQQTMLRQRAWRERQREGRTGSEPRAIELEVAANSIQPPALERQIVEVAAHLRELTSDLVTAYETPEHGMSAEQIYAASTLANLVGAVHTAAWRLQLDRDPADELASRRERRSR